MVREKANRERLQKAAYNQEKVGEAPVVIIAFALKSDWKHYLDSIFEEGVRRGYGKREMLPQIKKQASDFLEHGISAPVWVNRRTMIAVTTMMLVAEAYGLDTAPMEGFDPHVIGRKFGLPESAEIIALLALGYGQDLTNLMPDDSHWANSSMRNATAGAGKVVEMVTARIAPTSPR
ncbi:MAG: nitroreductase family protein [Verrucomicrobiota bacterium]